MVMESIANVVFSLVIVRLKMPSSNSSATCSAVPVEWSPSTYTMMLKPVLRFWLRTSLPCRVSVDTYLLRRLRRLQNPLHLPLQQL